MSKTAIISYSGGLDSTALLLNLIKNEYTIYALTYNYGQKHHYEIECAKTIVNYLNNLNKDINHSILDLSDLGKLLYSSLTTEGFNTPQGHYEDASMNDTVVPNRNAIFSAILYSHALSIAKKENVNVELFLAVHSGDHTIYPDCRIEFFNQLNKSFKLGNWNSEKVAFKFPYIDMDKKDILEDALESTKSLSLDFDYIFKNTNTSYSPDSNGKSMGKTGSDIERILAFNDLGMEDPLEYLTDWETVLKNALIVRQNFNKK